MRLHPALAALTQGTLPLPARNAHARRARASYIPSDARPLEYKCVEYTEEPLHGDLRKKACK